MIPREARREALSEVVSYEDRKAIDFGWCPPRRRPE